MSRIRLPARGPARAASLGGLVTGLVIVATVMGAILFPARAAASSSSLEVLDGIVAVSRDGVTFTEGRDGDLVQQGDIVRTGQDSHAVLTFYDGSTVVVEPDSELIVDTLAATADGDILMAMHQTVGRSWHVVSRTLTPNSKYEIRTPTATASVRGTAFLVSVAPSGQTNVRTTDGVVGTIAGGQEVQVPPGFETNVAPGGGPPDAATPAPPPAAVVRITIDATPNAAVVDASKRTVGVVNGLPVRYIPGSTVQLIDGKIVITIPDPSLGRLDTHVQPATPGASAVDVNVQVQVGGVTVGNIVEQRPVGGSGIARGGVVITTTGTYVVPDEDARRAEDPRIGRLPPPPAGGPALPFIAPKTVAPTPVVTAPPSFTSRFVFDPRLAVASATPTPQPAATSTTSFAGGFQPFVDTRTATSTATPAPNSGLTVFTTTPTELVRLTAATPTPTPTLGTKLLTPISPSLLATPTPTPEATLLLRTVDPGLLRTVAPTATPTPQPTLILRTAIPLDPALLGTPTPSPTGLILVTLAPRIAPTATPTPTPTPTIPSLTTLAPRSLPTASPTPAPTFDLRTFAPIVLPTVAPTASPTLAPRIIAPTLAPTLAPVLRTATPTPCIQRRLFSC